MRVHSELLPDTLARHTGLHRARTGQTLRQIKAAGRISTGRPYAPPLTERDIARILLALSAPSPSQAVEHERSIGRLVSAEGRTVEDAIIALLSAEATSGQIAVAQSSRFVEIATHSGRQTFGELAGGFSTFVIIPIPAVAAIGQALINQ